eukprot:4442217-Amphidinium_carterae.1
MGWKDTCCWKDTKLPHHYGVKSTSVVSLALIGNHFAQPQRVPAWIMPAEQPTQMFCMSNRQSTHFIILLFSGGCCFFLAMSLGKRKNFPMQGVLARGRSAWYETCKQQNCLALVSCVLLPAYSNALWLACT